MTTATFPSQKLACPAWCISHGNDAAAVAELIGASASFTGWHESDWRTWGETCDGPVFRFQMVRHDEVPSDGSDHLIGQIDFNVEVEGNPQSVGADGVMVPNEMRALACWLLAAADEADPHYLNGEPLEWHTPHRRPLLGCCQPKRSGTIPAQAGPEVEYWHGEMW